MRREQINELALTAVLTALALIIGVVESLIPPIFPMLPYVRIGLSNVVVLFCVVAVSYRSATAVTVIKSILVPIFLGNPMMFAYSITGSIFALIVTIILIKCRISMILVSAFSAIAHSVGQLIIACFFGGTAQVLLLLPYFALISLASGSLVGILVIYLLKKLPSKQ